MADRAFIRGIRDKTWSRAMPDLHLPVQDLSKYGASACLHSKQISLWREQACHLEILGSFNFVMTGLGSREFAVDMLSVWGEANKEDEPLTEKWSWRLCGKCVT